MRLSAGLGWVGLLVIAGAGAAFVGCGDEDPKAAPPSAGGGSGGASGGAQGGSAGAAVDPTAPLSFGKLGSLSKPEGKGSFRFGAATAATQIEDQNPNTDWYVFTKPKAEGGLAQHEFVGDAVKGYTNAVADVQLLTAMHLDTYRFSIEWARVEPKRNEIDEAALAHYGQVLDALKAAGVRPHLTLHHFSNPVWVHDPRDKDCANGPSDTNLCGLGHPTGGPEVIKEMGEFAKLIAERFGDRVDDWGTLNEPVNYLLASYGTGTFPPGLSYVAGNKVKEGFLPVVRDYLSAHAEMYRAIKQADTQDADGDGDPAAVGLSLNVAAFVPASNHEVSTKPVDIAARDRVVYTYHYLVPDSLLDGTFDGDLDGTPDEQHPEWKGTLDWLGAQYYFRTGVTGDPGVVPTLNVTPCQPPYDFGSCLPPVGGLTTCVPQMRYEFYIPGIYEVLSDFSKRWPALPLLVSESGLATNTGKRRAEHIVRTLEQIAKAQREGVDVRGYYHWSLTDNFEWAEGFAPHFGLYSVDYAGSYARTPTEGATTLGEIALARTITTEQRKTLGGEGPMTPDAEQTAEDAELCKDR